MFSMGFDKIFINHMGELNPMHVLGVFDWSSVIHANHHEIYFIHDKDTNTQ